MNTLKAEGRDKKTPAKRLRREGYVTGNLFGKEIEGSILLKINKMEAQRIHKECLKGSQLYLELDGKTYDVLLKEVDYDSLSHQILEMDFQALVQGEKVHSVAEIVLHNNEAIPGGVVEQHLEEIKYKALPEHIVDRIDIDCSQYKIGDIVKVSDLELYKNPDVDVVTHADTPVLSVVYSKNDIAEDEAEEGTDSEGKKE